MEKWNRDTVDVVKWTKDAVLLMWGMDQTVDVGKWNRDICGKWNTDRCGEMKKRYMRGNGPEIL